MVTVVKFVPRPGTSSCVCKYACISVSTCVCVCVLVCRCMCMYMYLCLYCVNSYGRWSRSEFLFDSSVFVSPGTRTQPIISNTSYISEKWENQYAELLAFSVCVWELCHRGRDWSLFHPLRSFLLLRMSSAAQSYQALYSWSLDSHMNPLCLCQTLLEEVWIHANAACQPLKSREWFCFNRRENPESLAWFFPCFCREWV